VAVLAWPLPGRRRGSHCSTVKVVLTSSFILYHLD
jgi:hypothetical protein